MNIRATPTQPPRPRYLMCRPQHFAVTYSINPWMDPKAWADNGDALHATAARQWAGLHRALLYHGALVEQVKPAPDLPDLVFTANAAVVLDGKALLARFRHPERQREQPVYAQSFRALQARGLIDEVIEMPDGAVLEGAGDCLWDGHRGTFWMGSGFRSDKTAAAVVAAAHDLGKLVAYRRVGPDRWVGSGTTPHDRLSAMLLARCGSWPAFASPETRAAILQALAAQHAPDGLPENAPSLSRHLLVTLAEADAAAAREGTPPLTRPEETPSGAA